MTQLDDWNARRELEAERSREVRRRAPGPLRARIHSMACAVCRRNHSIELHHIVPRSKFGKRDPDVHHEHNALPLCHTCHQHHHTTADRRVPRSRLTAEQIAFILARTSEAWLDRWYPKEA